MLFYLFLILEHKSSSLQKSILTITEKSGSESPGKTSNKAFGLNWGRRIRMVTTLRLLILLLLLKSMPSSAIAQNIVSADSMKIETEHIKLIFKRHPSGLIYLEHLSLPGLEGLIRKPETDIEKGKICPLWILSFLNPDITFSSNNAKFKHWGIIATGSSGIAKIQWSLKNDRLDMDILATIEVQHKTETTIWNLEVITNDQNLFTLQRATFPLIGDITPSDESGNIRLVNPRVWGQEFFRAEDIKLNSVYPSAGCQMQFLAYYNDKTRDGLYICTRDTLGYYKILRNTKANDVIPYARIQPWFMPETIENGHWVTPYPTEIRPYRGDWYEPAKFYRNWVKSTPIVKSNLEKQNKWILENDFWVRFGPLNNASSNFLNIDEQIETVKRIKNFLGCNTAIHLYNWHHYQFDYMYPKYFPPREGFENFLGNMKTEGIKVVPYINGRLVDARLVETDEYFEDGICLANLTDSLKYVPYTYNNTKFAVMCPSSTVWEDTLVRISEKLVNEYSCDGIYYDQVCNSPAIKCVSSKHNHIPDLNNIANNSSGTHWIKGYQEIFRRVADLQSDDNGFVFISEDAAEPWNDFFDIYLMYNSRTTDERNSFRIIPLYPTVYSSYILTMGFQPISMETDKYLDAHLSILGRSFVWGSQLGWMMPERLYNAKTLLNYAKNLVQARQRVRKFLHFGEMKRIPVILPEIPLVDIQEWFSVGNKRHFINFSLNPIQVSYWELNEISAAILLTNFTSQDFTNKSLQLNLDLSDTMLTNGIYRLLDSSDQEKEVNINSLQLSIDFQLKPYEAKVIELLAK
jgi:hypothetical protein